MAYNMNSKACTFLIGPSKSGKTSLSHAIMNSPLSIDYNGRLGFQLFVKDEPVGNRQIGRFGDSCTINPEYYCEGHLCDFPGLGDTRGNDTNLNAYISLFNELQKFEYIRIVICIDENTIKVCNASRFAIITDEVISLLNLSKEDLNGICLLVTKSSEEYCQEIAEDFQYFFPNKKNFIIEAIKKRKMEIHVFEKPILGQCGYELSLNNIREIRQTLFERPKLESLKMQQNINSHLRSKLLAISELSDRSSIVFVSKLHRQQLSEISGRIVCIDKDIELEGEIMTIEASIIFVLLDSHNKKKRKIVLKGSNPQISIKCEETVFNGINLIISTKSSQDIDFPDPTDESFETNERFFRIESFCINGYWKEYATLNNKYLDLIAYINPSFGAIYVDQKFKIRTDTAAIELKLYVNECTRNKENIEKRFKSLKFCRNVDEYLEGRRENPQLKVALLKYAVNLPSIFQLLMKDPFIFCIKRGEISELVEIQSKLLSNYLFLIDALLKGLINTENNDSEIITALNNFLLEFNSNRDNFDKDQAQIKYRVIECFRNHEKKKIDAFYELYNLLSIDKLKFELFNYKITGDKSEYQNFNAAIALHDNGKKIIDKYKVNYFEEGSIISNKTLSLAALRVCFLSGISAAAYTSLGVLSASISGPLAGIGILLIDQIIAIKQSGYFEGQTSIAGYELRVDCLIPLS